jgi:crotonobetainyl-CoA:carnitine CoA-transferase CaiB-like acyl-CoA transferase
VIAADLWEMRGGKTQRIEVATREAAASLISFAHQRFADVSKAPESFEAALAPRTSANGFFRTKDERFVYLHQSFPQSTTELLRILGCADTQEAVDRTLLTRDALDWESLLAEAGVCAAMCRSPQEWDTSEQGRALASLPVVEVIKISDSDPEPMRGGQAPLTDVRVLDLTRVLAGPTCARTLAHFGADTMVISAPGLPSIPAFVADTGHGKRAAFCDLNTNDGRATLQRLVRSADVFSQGYRQGALARHGFSSLDLARMRPGLINVEINCYGHEGPWRGWRGWEQLAQTVTGMAYQHGGAQSPVLQPAAVCDYTTGFLAAFGALIALRRRALYGGSYLVRASLCQTAMWVRAMGYDNETRLRGEGFKTEEIERWRISADTGFGQMHFLRPAVRMSQTEPTWTRGVVPLGTHPALWN